MLLYSLSILLSATYYSSSAMFSYIVNHSHPFLCNRKNGMDLYAVKSNSKRTHYFGVFKRKRCVLTISIDPYNRSSFNFN